MAESKRRAIQRDNPFLSKRIAKSLARKGGSTKNATKTKHGR